jgi:hypothetical protein
MKRFDKLVQPKETAYPEAMRRQLWPLCCGASILSGFKAAQKSTTEELVKQIKSTINEYVPDLQVYAGETICPNLVYLTLNESQMASPKIMEAIKTVGFLKFAEASPRGRPQGFFVFDMTNTFQLIADEVKVRANA